MKYEEQVLFSLPLSRMEPIFKSWVREAIAGMQSFNDRPAPAEDQLIGIKEAAKILNLAVSSVYTLVHKRQIPFMKRHQKLYFSRAELMDWIKEGRRKTTAEIEADAIHSMETLLKTPTTFNTDLPESVVYL